MKASELTVEERWEFAPKWKKALFAILLISVPFMEGIVNIMCFYLFGWSY